MRQSLITKYHKSTSNINETPHHPFCEAAGGRRIGEAVPAPTLPLLPAVCYDFSRIIYHNNSNQQTQSISTYFDAVFVINLETDTSRKKNILKLEDHGYSYYYVAAITPQDLDNDFFNSIETTIDNGSSYCFDRTKICLALTNILILNFCIYNRLNSCLILEDDFLFHKSFISLFKQAMGELPIDWNILWLGYKQHQSFQPEIYNNHWLLPNTYTWGTHACGFRNCLAEVREAYSALDLPIDLCLTHKLKGCKKYIAKNQLIITQCDELLIGPNKDTKETYELWNWNISNYDISLNKKIDLINTTHGGPWKMGCNSTGSWGILRDSLLNISHNDGISFFDFADRDFGWEYKEKEATKEWTGIIHHPYILPEYIYGSSKKLIASEPFLKSIDKCSGLFVLSNHLKEFLINDFNISSKSIPIKSFIHPVNLFSDVSKFNLELFYKNNSPLLVSLGGAFRKFSTLDKIKCSYSKAWLFGMHPTYLENMCAEFKVDNYQPNGGAAILGTKTYTDYDRILSSNIAFIDVVDSSANNAILDCIAHNTPIIAKKHPAIIEYLGEGYPLYFETVEEAEKLINSNNSILDGYLYLLNKNKGVFNFYSALKQIYKSI